MQRFIINYPSSRKGNKRAGTLKLSNMVRLNLIANSEDTIASAGNLNNLYIVANVTIVTVHQKRSSKN
jgi:hypothetical protein